MPPGKGTQMDPTQSQNFYRAMIRKEEKFYNVKGDEGNGALPAKEAHLAGSGAVVKSGREAAASDGAQSIAAFKTLPGTGGSQAGSVKGSQAGSKASTSAAMLSRLQRLEAEMAVEKEKRLAAEMEIRELLGKTADPVA